MNALPVIVGAVAAFAATLLLTGAVRRFALHTNMLDVPGERSSHSVPTPRGGGLAIGICLFASVVVLHALGQLPRELAWAIASGGVLIFVVAWLEDRRGLATAVRAAAYLAAAALGVTFMGGVAGGAPQWLANAGAVLGVAWLINLYNFMDGTDALAAGQAIVTAAVAGALFHVGGEFGPAWICVILASACTGFLYWNWPPARIFMGDTGSCLLGFSFGMLALAGENSGTVPFLAWIILLSLFVCDATLTLLLRVIRGEKWYSAHRSHAYQLLVRAGMSHRRLAITVLGINVLLLGPLTVFAVLHRQYLVPVAAGTLCAASVLWAAVQFRLRHATLQ